MEKNPQTCRNGTISVLYIYCGGVLEICHIEFFLYWEGTVIKDKCHQNRLINRIKYLDFQKQVVFTQEY